MILEATRDHMTEDAQRSAQPCTHPIHRSQIASRITFTYHARYPLLTIYMPRVFTVHAPIR